MKGVILFPILQAAAFVAFVSVWLVYAVFVASAGEKVEYTSEADDGVTLDYYTYARGLSRGRRG